MQPADPDTHLSRQAVWLPEGDWYDFTTGQHYIGNRWHGVYGGLDHVPVFAKAGGIVPLAAEQAWSETGNPAVFDLNLFAGANNQFTLYEDDGETVGYQQERYALTKITQTWNDQQLDITIGSAKGITDAIPQMRRWRAAVFGITSPDELTVMVGDQPQEVSYTYDMERECLLLSAVSAPIDQTITIQLSTTAETLRSNRDRQADTLQQMLNVFRLDSQTKRTFSNRLSEFWRDPEEVLNRYDHVLTRSQKQALMELVTESGAFHVNYLQDQHILVMWNNRPDFSPTYRFTTYTEARWDREKFGAEIGDVPTFKQLRFPKMLDNEHRSGGRYPLRWWFKLHYSNIATLEYEA